MIRKGSKSIMYVVFASMIAISSWAENLREARLSGTSIIAGKERVKLALELDQPSDVRVSLWKDDTFVLLIDNVMTKETEWSLEWDGKDSKGQKVPPGNYTVKIETGEDIVLDPSFGKDGVLDYFTSPFTVRVDPLGHLWLADIGSKDSPDSKILYKMDANGNVLKKFPTKEYFGAKTPQNFCFDQDGALYIGSGGHSVVKLDQNGKKLMSYGGMKNEKDARGRQKPSDSSTIWGVALGIGANNRLYIKSSNGTLVYDRTHTDLEGFLYKSTFGMYFASLRGLGHAGPSVISNPETGDMYWVSHTHMLHKLVDTGTDLKEVYRYKKTKKMVPGFITGATGIGTDWAGTLFIANRLNYCLEKFVDTGTAFKWVRSYGAKGRDLDKKGFYGIHDVCLDGDSLYIVEDGQPIPFQDSAKSGNHRLSKWKFTYKSVKNIKLNIK